MKTLEFRGVMPALITPFDQKGEVDIPKLRNFLDWLMPQVDGLYVCGSYGSGPIMTVEQRKLMTEIVCKFCKGKGTIIIHVGDPSTDITIELAKHAVESGADAVASLTPYYYLHGPELITNHFKRLIDAIDAPIFLYNNPKYTNYCITPEQIAELAAYGLAGLKDSSTSIQLFYNCIASVENTDFVFLVGSQTMLVPGLGAGGAGCVSGLSNLFPALVNSIFKAAEAGDNAKAVALQHEANELRSLTGSGIPVPFYHCALKFRGIDIGVPRLPLLPISKEQEEKIGQALAKYPNLTK